MPSTSFHGSFETGDPEIVEQILRSWLSTDDLRVQPRRGWETHYETDGFELLCYEASPQNPPNYFLLEGHIDGAVEDAVARLHELAEQCRSAKLEFSIDYEEVDAAGNPLSEERTIN
ncbi:hypothetical protein [Nocardia vinacea]|uniref:hypothetical protein n=1 Tax=Nocardia vinacea TaxID=96468 RepID=UPI0002DEC0D5|nr:hypothetical protein [Nocardia vinacea]